MFFYFFNENFVCQYLGECMLTVPQFQAFKRHLNNRHPKNLLSHLIARNPFVFTTFLPKLLENLSAMLKKYTDPFQPLF